MRRSKLGPGEPSGCLLLNKRPGITSFEALAGVKRAFATDKVGHTGTLDKFASGLLLVLVGRAVKLSSWFSGMDKQYEGTICFGVETDTLDPEGSRVAEGRIPSREALEAALPQFQGDILQAPPEYSAIHVQGQRSSQLARKGKAVALDKRPVSVYALELKGYEVSGEGYAYAQIWVHCSKGTYIRALARDLARAVGSRGYLTALHRTGIAGFQVSQGVDLGDRADPAPLLEEALRPMDQSILKALGIPYVKVNPETVLQMIHGKPLDDLIDESTVYYPPSTGPVIPYIGVLDETGNLAAIIEKTEKIEKTNKKKNWSYGYVYARP
ncbi:MAG: tRNA pseudouridine(55) synthase TruB [Treponema sp.]|jgi:tRNA pseudouridine55 synthase|nr:tRNA pseudouridine(55) synthase TruB [Treponema sp.]